MPHVPDAHDSRAPLLARTRLSHRIDRVQNSYQLFHCSNGSDQSIKELNVSQALLFVSLGRRAIADKGGLGFHREGAPPPGQALRPREPRFFLLCEIEMNYFPDSNSSLHRRRKIHISSERRELRSGTIVCDKSCAVARVARCIHFPQPLLLKAYRFQAG
jgi:hypothetical protein